LDSRAAFLTSSSEKLVYRRLEVTYYWKEWGRVGVTGEDAGPC
jgi:hypothetical protein